MEISILGSQKSLLNVYLIGHEDSVGLSFPLLDGVCTPKLLLPYRNVGQQQAA
jgi:hypothetical protein